MRPQHYITISIQDAEKLLGVYLSDEEQHYEGCVESMIPTRAHIVHVLWRLSRNLERKQKELRHRCASKK